MTKKKYLKDDKGMTRAISTDELGLEKPLTTDYYDIDVHNRNMDKIDTSIKNVKLEHQSSMDGLKEKIDTKKLNADNTTVKDKITVTSETDGHYVEMGKGNYEVRNAAFLKAFFGLRKLDDDRFIPRLAMGHDGLSKSKDNYFVIQAYPKNNNPQTYPFAYVDIAYRCQNYINSEGIGDVSNLKIYGDGNMRLSPVNHFEITTNFNNGVYAGEAERLIAEFGSSASEYYDKYMDIPTIRNTQNGTGLILAHRSSNGVSSCFVRVNCDSNGDRFFRPLTNEGNVALGSTGYPWKSVHTKTTYSGEGVIIRDTDVRAINSNDDILDNIEFIDTYTKNIEDILIIDVTKLRNTNYINEDEGSVYINDGEMIKLLLKEVKELKNRVKMLEGEAV